ncbi:MAG TPA: hypothetical protein VK324_07430 [Tepidisphaeraceae bacterium]|nr:hypothetical protein [Tepidisphaeraceae bacterium]
MAPAICLALLGGMTYERSTRTTARDAAPYHARALAAVERLPYIIKGPTSQFIGKDVPKDDPATKSAIALLKPNAYLCRRFEEFNTVPGRRERAANLLIVQCQDSRDMLGHYPKNCYPAQGHTPAADPVPHRVTIEGLDVNATEYHFTKTERGYTTRLCVYNFMIVPGHGIVPTIEAVQDVAEDYQRRNYGAAQYQVLMSSDVPREEREDLFRTLIAANAPIIRVLLADEGTERAAAAAANHPTAAPGVTDAANHKS